MLYNIEKKKIQSMVDCFSCPHWNKNNLSCQGLNKCCFEYDQKTGICIDGVTKLPLKIKGE